MFVTKIGGKHFTFLKNDNTLDRKMSRISKLRTLKHKANIRYIMPFKEIVVFKMLKISDTHLHKKLL